MASTIGRSGKPKISRPAIRQRLRQESEKLSETEMPEEDQEITEARKKQREKDLKRRGRRALLLTSGLGLTGNPLVRRSRLLGG